jgi:hypothetical protein
MVLLVSMASPLLAAPPAADSLGWMAGAWAGRDGDVEMEEVWTAPRGGTLIGLHRDVRGPKTVSFEFLRIETTADGLVYQASPMGRPATPFKLVEGGPRRAVFERKAHDFPQRILYWLDEQGALHARIEGPQGGRNVSQEWRWEPARLGHGH